MAIGDKIFLADKESQDAIKRNVDDIHARVGTTTDGNGSASSGTLMGKINYAINYLSDLRTKVIQFLDVPVSSRQSAVDALDQYHALNTNTAANHSPSATGTLSQKLSHIIDKLASFGAPKYPKTYRVAHSATPGSNVTIVNVSGPGHLEFIYGNAHRAKGDCRLQVIVDGVDVTPLDGFADSPNWMVHYMQGDGRVLINILSVEIDRIRPLYFSKSLVIRCNNTGDATYTCYAAYAVNE